MKWVLLFSLLVAPAFGQSHAIVRCMWGVLGRMTSDAFSEFWPDIKKKVFKK